MDAKDLRESLDILIRYGYGAVEVEYAMIFVGTGRADPPDMDPKDVRRLEVLGWNWDIGGRGWKHGV